MGSIRQAILVWVEQVDNAPSSEPPIVESQNERERTELVALAQKAGCAEVVMALPAQTNVSLHPGLGRIVTKASAPGARWKHLFAEAWKRRYQPCVLLYPAPGCLPAVTHILEAFEAMRPGRASAAVVLGATDRGACCLIGLKWPTPALFDEIDWTAHVYEQLLFKAQALQLAVHLLPTVSSSGSNE